MIKVKTFIMNSGNKLHIERLDNSINLFLAENNIEVIDIKYSTSISNSTDGNFYWVPSAMLIYKEKDE